MRTIRFFAVLLLDVVEGIKPFFLVPSVLAVSSDELPGNKAAAAAQKCLMLWKWTGNFEFNPVPSYLQSVNQIISQIYNSELDLPAGPSFHATTLNCQPGGSQVGLDDLQVAIAGQAASGQDRNKKGTRSSSSGGALEEMIADQKD